MEKICIFCDVLKHMLSYQSDKAYETMKSSRSQLTEYRTHPREHKETPPHYYSDCMLYF